MQMSRRAFSAGVVAFPALLATAAAAGPAEAGALTRALEEERRRRGLPALAGLVMRHGRVLESAAVGVRARGADVTVAGSDRWHIGSCAKAMTATLIARYVERGALDWNATVGDLLPELSSGMDRAAARITLHQLLTMTAGLPANPTSTPNEGGLANGLRLMISGNDHLIGQLRALEGLADNDVERRKQIAARMLASPPRWEPGSRFGYSNTAYVIVGAIAEAAGRAPYEDLLAEEVFRPLGVESFGFGAPGRSDILDQPRGHVARRDGAPVPPDSVAAELPSFLRPAGGVHMSLGDWSRFVADHVSGE
ncbi:MAG: serine hydrolase domain-containing protein, partial [Hyphomonadaceae bacterium]|nr:serine hydrolase domain-containing protein [Hyphomonadaceae bacterium]